MKVILSQCVKVKGEQYGNSVSKEYESDIMPIVGIMVEDPLWKDPYEYEIKEVTINYYDNSCFVVLDEYKGEILKEKKKLFADMAKLHGWKASWDF
jgi:hypothetical protein